jgi:hypothetical protein
MTSGGPGSIDATDMGGYLYFRIHPTNASVLGVLGEITFAKPFDGATAVAVSLMNATAAALGLLAYATATKVTFGCQTAPADVNPAAGVHKVGFAVSGRERL